MQRRLRSTNCFWNGWIFSHVRSWFSGDKVWFAPVWEKDCHPCIFCLWTAFTPVTYRGHRNAWNHLFMLLPIIYLGGTKPAINCCKPGGLEPWKRMSLLLIPNIEVGEKQPRMPGEVPRLLPSWWMLCLHLLLKKRELLDGPGLCCMSVM